MYAWKIVVVVAFKVTSEAGDNIVWDTIYDGECSAGLYKSYIDAICILRLLLVTTGVVGGNGIDVTVKGRNGVR